MGIVSIFLQVFMNPLQNNTEQSDYDPIGLASSQVAI